MRVKRQKNFRKIMRFYRMSFGLQDPYRVLVDGTFLSHALEQKIHVKEQLPKLLDGRVTPMVTNCVMSELRSLGSRALGAAIIAKGYYRLKCNCDISASECIKRQLAEGNSKGFLVATQDAELARHVREVPGVPLIRLHGPVPHVEDPSSSSKAFKSSGEAARLKASEWEMPKLPELQDARQRAELAASLPPKKKKGPKGPNPLSCMKAKKKPQTAGWPPAKPQVAPATATETQAAAAAEPVRQAKRARSRKMGTRKAGELVTAAPKASEAAEVEESCKTRAAPKRPSDVQSARKKRRRAA